MAFNRRLLFWLIREYFKKFGKSIFIFFILGIGFFFIFKSFLISYIDKFSIIHNEKIGLVGSYTSDNLPNEILNKLSNGLIKIDPSNDTPRPDLAKDWNIQNNGKTYIFHLKKNVYFSDGSLLSAKDINYSFTDVKRIILNENTIVFKLKQSYAPFLNTVSKPIFKKNFIGTGNYKILEIKFNAGFLTSITLVSKTNYLNKITYIFYPSQKALKLGLMLGEINIAQGLNNLSFENKNISDFKNISYQKKIDYKTLITVFYNNGDANLSDKRLRDALAYALPDIFLNGQRAFSPFSPNSWAYVQDTLHSNDLEHSRLLLKEIKNQNKQILPNFTLYYLPELKNIAFILKYNWSKIGLNIIPKEVETTPLNFQMFLTYFNEPTDPDQYTLWHSDQQNNITGFKDLRIDKLLEDGRRTINENERFKIYTDFQKYLIDDQPASFLYFPYVYNVVRK